MLVWVFFRAKMAVMYKKKAIFARFLISYLLTVSCFCRAKKFVRGVHDDTVIDVFHGGFQESTIYEWT